MSESESSESSSLLASAAVLQSLEEEEEEEEEEAYTNYLILNLSNMRANQMEDKNQKPKQTKT